MKPYVLTWSGFVARSYASRSATWRIVPLGERCRSSDDDTLISSPTRVANVVVPPCTDTAATSVPSSPWYQLTGAPPRGTEVSWAAKAWPTTSDPRGPTSNVSGPARCSATVVVPRSTGTLPGWW